MTNKTVLPDVLETGLAVVFCGTAASAKSAQAKAYYAGPGNNFWHVLFQTGLTTKLLKPEQFKQLLQFGIGLTDVAKHRSGNDNVLKKRDFSPQQLRKKILRYQPHVLAFTSKRAGKEFFGCSSIDYGFQGDQINATKIYVLPSPSGAARGYWDEQIWQALADYLKDSTATQ